MFKLINVKLTNGRLDMLLRVKKYSKKWKYKNNDGMKNNNYKEWN